MKKLLAVLALIAVATPVSAADFQRPYGSSPLSSSWATSPGMNWSGFYLGAMGGYSWSGSVPLVGFVDLGNRLRGGFGGGTAGYNWQQPGSPLVLGIEVDAAWSDSHFGAFGPLGDFQDRLQSFGSVTGRVGWAANAALLYAKGGFAWADNKASATTLPPLVGAQAESNMHTGWTIGGGLEYMFAPAWSAKAEYMYADYGHENYFSNILDLGITTHSVKAGINYHFNWGGPAVTGPLVTRY
jgi:outer membrane immunogenic protein